MRTYVNANDQEITLARKTQKGDSRHVVHWLSCKILVNRNSSHYTHTRIHWIHTVHCILDVRMYCTYVRTSSIIQSCPIWHITMATRTIAIYVLWPSLIQHQNTHNLCTITSPSQPCHSSTAHCGWGVCVPTETASGVVTRVMDELSLTPSCVYVECTTHREAIPVHHKEWCEQAQWQLR